MKAVLSAAVLFLAMLLTGIDAKASECSDGCSNASPCTTAPIKLPTIRTATL